jgi:hypothetical protein
VRQLIHDRWAAGMKAIRELAIYSGRERLGTLVEAAGKCRAIGPTGKKLGSFSSRKSAMAAIDALAERATARAGRRGA